jgi:putative acetyltransferase
MSNQKFQIFETKHNVPDVKALLDASEAYAHSLYPPEGIFMLEEDDMGNDNVHLYVVRDAENKAVACGAMVINDKDHGEIKRMFVTDSARGNGLGKLVLEKLEETAAAEGVRYIQLETGPLQPEAINLYKKYGYYEIGPFGNYEKNDLSIFMEKKLTH